MATACTRRSRPCSPSVPWRPRRGDRYERRRPEKTPLHRFISRHLETWLAARSLGERPVATHVEGEFREYLRCGILCFGFARARCTSCGHGFLVAFSCKGRGVCPSCTGRRMAQTAAHLADHVIPPVPVRQWVISVPKRLRGILADRPAAVTALTRIFLDEIERWLGAAVAIVPDAAARSSLRPHLGAVSLLHRFGSALNRHVHLHACVTDGLFRSRHECQGAEFLSARPVTPADILALTERVRTRLVRWFLRHGLLDAEAAADMLAWQNSGFSIDASVRVALVDRDVPNYFKSLEHLLRYCARPAFALERLSLLPGRNGGPKRIGYALPRHKRGQWVGPGRRRKAVAPGENGVVDFSPFEFLDRLGDLVPPPRKHRHSYHGVFAPNHPLRTAVTALAIGNATARGDVASPPPLPPGEGRGEGAPDAPGRAHETSRISWAKLIARIAEDFPLACPACGGDIRLIAFIINPAPIRKILLHLGEPLDPPPLAPARGPPTVWAELVQVHDDRDAMQAAPDELPVIDIRSL